MRCSRPRPSLTHLSVRFTWAGVRFSRLTGSSSRRAALTKSHALWDAQSGAEIRTFIGHSSRIDDVAFSPDGKILLTGSHYDKTARLWDVATGAEIRRFQGHANFLSIARISPDGKTVLTAGDEKTAIILWDAATGKELLRLPAQKNNLREAIFSPDSKFVITSSYENVTRVWEVATGKEVRQLRPAEKFSPHLLAFSPDGLRLVAEGDGRGYGDFITMDAATGNELQLFKGHTASVNCLTFSPDGLFVASASDDKTVRLWDASTGRELARYLGHFENVLIVSFLPGGKFIAAATDASVRFWELNFADINAAAKPSPGQVARELTSAIEKQQGNAKAWRSRAEHYLRWKKYENAAADFTQALKIDRKDVASWIGRGWARYHLNDVGNAFSDLSQAIKLDPKSSTAYGRLGAVYRAAEDWPSAMKELEAALKLDARNADALTWRGLTSEAMGISAEKYISDFNKALEIDPSHVMALIARGTTFRKLKQFDKALADLRNALEIEADSTDALLRRAELYIDMKESANALADLKRAVELAPDSVQVLGQVSVAHGQMGEYQAQLEDLALILELVPDDVNVRFERALLCHAAGENDKALADLEGIDDTNRPELPYWRAKFHLAKGDLDLALAQANRCLELKPNTDYALNLRATVYYAKQDWDSAIEDYTVGLSVSKVPLTQAYLHAGRAACQRQGGKYDRARKDIEKAYELQNKLVVETEQPSALQHYFLACILGLRAQLREDEADRDEDLILAFHHLKQAVAKKGLRKARTEKDFLADALRNDERFAKITSALK